MAYGPFVRAGHASDKRKCSLQRAEQLNELWRVAVLVGFRQTPKRGNDCHERFKQRPVRFEQGFRDALSRCG